MLVNVNVSVNKIHDKLIITIQTKLKYNYAEIASSESQQHHAESNK